MDADQLFLMTFDDLAERIQRANNKDALPMQREYDCLMLALLLRKLLLDGTPLADQVNRRFKIRLTYPLQAWPVLVGSGGVPFDPASPAQVPTWVAFVNEMKFSRDDMLKWPVAVWNNTQISAREVIDHLANVAGGVHSGQ